MQRYNINLRVTSSPMLIFLHLSDAHPRRTSRHRLCVHTICDGNFWPAGKDKTGHMGYGLIRPLEGLD